jgi:carbamoyl-phosphate synthase large subunit
MMLPPNMKTIVICVTSAGRRVALLQTLRNDAAALGLSPRIVALDRQPGLSAACALADVSEAVPECSQPGYPEAVMDSCRRHGVTLLVPTIDTELTPLAAWREKFMSIGVMPVLSSQEAVKVARDKFETFTVLSRAGIPMPATCLLSNALLNPAQARFPAVVKPSDGSSSRGLYFAGDWAEVPRVPNPERHVFQERCQGPEYTVNCYVDQQGDLRCAVPHLRIETRGGEVSKGRTERRADLADLSRDILSALPGLRGAFCFQSILTESGPRVFEINARFGGGYPLAHAAGATFGKWLIQEALGMRCEANNNWTDGLLMLRYDDAAFLPPKI